MLCWGVAGPLWFSPSPAIRINVAVTDRARLFGCGERARLLKAQIQSGPIYYDRLNTGAYVFKFQCHVFR